jgi:hypothetical protein
MTHSYSVSPVRPLAQAEAAALLANIVERARRGAPESIVVFDLDSTLLDNRPRQSRIMREYGRACGLAALIANQPDHWAGWDVQIAMRNSGLDEDRIAEHAEPFKGFWRERFFTSEYCVDDRLVPGAELYAQAVIRTGAQLCYVTGRHEPMRPGTIECFARLGLPAPSGRIELLMKPTLDESDDDYKARAYEALRRRGTVIAVFDNEPTHINGYKLAFPEALSVHIATDHSLRDVAVADGIPSILNFAAFG